jgi:hypothetical protein
MDRRHSLQQLMRETQNIVPWKAIIIQKHVLLKVAWTMFEYQGQTIVVPIDHFQADDVFVIDPLENTDFTDGSAGNAFDCGFEWNLL